MAKDYDIGEAFKAIEEELIQSMIRNMKAHRVDETDEKKQWEMWQAKQLDALERYKKKNRKKYKGQFQKINYSIDRVLNQAYVEGGMEQEIEILDAIKKRYGDNPPAKVRRIKEALAERLPFGTKKDKDFFQLNDERLDALVHATTSDMAKAESAMLRMVNDQYRKIIFNAQVYAASGAGTYEKAVDMATKDFLAAGINCIEYKDGKRVNIKSYACMAIRTADKRARLYADGKVRQKLGIHTVITKKRMNACPKCLPFVDRILIDDVWSGGTKDDGPYMLLSEAMAAGFLHPNCKDHFSTYMPGITDPPEGGFTQEEINQVEEKSNQEAQQQYAERQEEKFERLTKYSLGEDNKREYARKSKEWNIAASKNHPSYDELENYLKKKYNAIMDDDVRALSLRQVNQTMAEFEQVMNDFPGIRNNFTGINTAPRGKAGLVPNGELAFNPEYYKRLDTRLMGTGFHESGHLMELSLIKKYNPGADIDTVCDLYADGKYARAVLEKAYSRIGTGKSINDMRKDISNYALVNESETLAEAVKDYYFNGQQSSPLSRQIIKVLKEDLR